MVLAETSDEARNWLAQHKIDSTKRLTEIIKARNGLEKAVEVVLSPFLGAYCLAQGQSLPAALLPHHNIALFDSQASRNQAPPTRDWPRLIDHIQCEIDLSSLLGHVYLCQSRVGGA